MMVTKNDCIRDIVSKDMRIVAIFMASGIPTILSSESMNMTIEEIAFNHGIEPDGLTERINEYLEK